MKKRQFMFGYFLLVKILLIILICAKFHVNTNSYFHLNIMFFSCADLAVPHDIMHHVVRVESSGNPYAIGVVGGRLQRQPKKFG